MNTYLINAPHDQKINTVENVSTVGIFAYSNPAYYETKSLANDFGDIVEADQIIICRDSQLKDMVVVNEVVEATDKSGGKHDGLPVKILRGQIIKKSNKLSVAVFANRIKNEGIEPPNLVNPNLTGFKQGVFAERLSVEQLCVGVLNGY